MKRTLLLAISILALTATSQPLFAAEAETPAPRERAPAAARERAPAAQRQARPAQAPSQQAAQPSTSSFTGSQAGGFGGGNVGGGSFADPVALCASGFNTISGGIPCPAVPFNYSASHRVNGTGGAFYSYSIPLFGWAVIGLQGEVAFGSIRSSSTQSNVHFTGAPFGPDSFGQITTETYSSSFNQSTNGSVLVKVGVPVSIPLLLGRGVVSKDPVSPYSMNQTILIYGIVGPTFARVEGDYTYTGTSCPLSSSSSCTNAYGALNWSQTRTGIAGGVGAEWAFMPGVNLRLEYRYTSFGDISQDVPVAAVLAGGGACSSCATVAHIDIKNLDFHSVRFGVGFGF